MSTTAIHAGKDHVVNIIPINDTQDFNRLEESILMIEQERGKQLYYVLDFGRQIVFPHNLATQISNTFSRHEFKFLVIAGTERGFLKAIVDVIGRVYKGMVGKIEFVPSLDEAKRFIAKKHLDLAH